MKSHFILGLGLLFNSNLFSQNGPVASGGNAAGSGGSVSYSIGQTDYITATGSNGIITQGIQQPYEIFVITQVTDIIKETDLAVYPNPTVNDIFLRLNSAALINSTYEVTDLTGKKIFANSITETETKLNFSELPTATYFISIITNNQTVRTYKIIKN